MAILDCIGIQNFYSLNNIYYSEFLRRTRTLLMISAVLFPNASSAKEAVQLYEQEIKAGLLYNFLKYTTWPDANKARQNSKISLCVFGSDPFSGYLVPMEGRSVNQRIINIIYIRAIEEISTCHMLFVNSGEKAKWLELSEYLADKNILTVSDIKGFAQYGGMIELSLKGSHINVVLNQDAVESAHLSVQDRLLKLVSIVRNNDKGGGR